ncbi:substrate-binding domain-containing protein [Lacrimispora sp.]
MTTLSPPVEKMAQVGVDMMLKLISGEEKNMIHHISLIPELLERETT